jgi:hypothetical protein
MSQISNCKICEEVRIKVQADRRPDTVFPRGMVVVDGYTAGTPGGRTDDLQNKFEGKRPSCQWPHIVILETTRTLYYS